MKSKQSLSLQIQQINATGVSASTISRIDWLNVCVSRLSRTFLVVVAGLICQMEIWTGSKGSIFFVSHGVRLC